MSFRRYWHRNRSNQEIIRLRRKILVLEQQKKELELEIAQLKNGVSMETVDFPDCFFVPRREKAIPIFTNNLEDVRKVLLKMTDLTNLRNVIKSTTLPDADSYLKIVDSFVGQVKKIDSHKLEKYDAEELSYEVTNKFFKAVKNILLDNLVCAFSVLLCSDIDKGIKGQVIEVLAGLNRYFGDCGIYSRLVKINTNASDVDLQEFDFVSDPTIDLPSGTITSISILPYYMDYFEEDGEIDRFVYCGKGCIAKGR